jgi:hypothetical protein
MEKKKHNVFIWSVFVIEKKCTFGELEITFFRYNSVEVEDLSQ